MTAQYKPAKINVTPAVRKRTEQDIMRLIREINDLSK